MKMFLELDSAKTALKIHKIIARKYNTVNTSITDSLIVLSGNIIDVNNVITSAEISRYM